MISSRFRSILLTVLAIAIVAGVVYLVLSLREPQEKVVSFAPQYDLILKDYDNQDVRLSSFKRKILVVHAWASWCTYCEEEIKNLSKLKEIYADDIQILAVNRAEDLATARSYSDKLSLEATLTFLLDPSDSFYKAIEGYAMPETLFVNEKGDVLFHQHGPMKISEVIERINALVQ